MSRTKIIIWGLITLFIILGLVRIHNKRQAEFNQNEPVTTSQATSTENQLVNIRRPLLRQIVTQNLINQAQNNFQNNSSNEEVITDEESDSTAPSNNTLICKTPFPIYMQYGNRESTIYFYEDQYKTYLFAKDRDGTKKYSLSDKNTLNKTNYLTVTPDGECTGGISESFDPKQAAIYNPFACDQDRMVYGFCPIANISMSKLIWTGNKNVLSNQYGRGYGKYLDETESGTLLTEKSWRIVPIIDNAKTITSLVLPMPDHDNETFTYKLEENESPEEVADKFGLLMTQIYSLNPNLNGEYVLKSCLRVANKNSPYRIYCIDTETCQNIGLNTTQPVVRSSFDLGIFTPPKSCKQL